MPPSRRLTQVRSVNTAAAGYGGGPIARSFLTALRLPSRWASASAHSYELDSAADESPICPLPTYAATFSGKRAAYSTPNADPQECPKITTLDLSSR